MSSEFEMWPAKTITYVTTTEKLCVTIDKGKNPGHFREIK